MFLKNILKFHLYYSPEPAIGPIGDLDRNALRHTAEEDSTDDKDDKDDKTDDKEDDKDDDKEEEEVDDTDADDDDETDEEEEDDEKDDDKETDDEEEEEDDKEVTDLPSLKEIKAKYPNLLKEFPDVRAALYRDQQYADLVGSPKEAQDLVARADVLARVEKDLIGDGDPVELLKTIQAENKESYKSVVFRTLTYVQDTDKDLYYELASLPLKQILRAAYREGNGDKTDLGRAAAYIHKYFFNDTDFNKKAEIESGVKAKEKSKEQVEYENRIKTIDEREYTTFKTSVDTTYVNRMSNIIREKLDKDERINDYMKKNIISDILTEIRDQLNGDKSYLAKMSSLFKQAQANGYTGDFKSRILTAALARAKSLTPAIRAKVVSEALGKGKVREEKKERRPVERREARQQDRNERTPAKPKAPMSDMDVIRGK